MEIEKEREAKKYLFAMQDAESKFSISLDEVVKCILIAEQKGILPSIPFDIREVLCNIAKGDE